MEINKFILIVVNRKLRLHSIYRLSSSLRTWRARVISGLIIL